MNKYFCILGGGGIRGAAYTGAIKALEDLNLEITGWAGSSIGAVVAGLVAFKYSPDEIQEVFDNINFEFFKDINLNFGKDFALSKGGNFYEWMKNKIETKFYGENEIKAPVCFKDLEKELVIYTVDLASSKFFEFSKAKTPSAEIAQAIRISVGMPGLYSPVFNEDECLVDGDLLKSMPLWAASETIKNSGDKILEFRLEANEKKKKITNTVEYLNAVYDTVSGIASDYVINMYKNCDKYDYIKINLDGISVVDFMIGKDKKREMAKTGYETTMSYFKNFYPIKKEKLDELYLALLTAFKRVVFLIKNKEIDEARYEIANLLEIVLKEKEILDKEILKEIVLNKKLFDGGYMVKKRFIGKKPVLADYNSILKSMENLTEKIEIKLKG